MVCDWQDIFSTFIPNKLHAKSPDFPVMFPWGDLMSFSYREPHISVVSSYRVSYKFNKLLLSSKINMKARLDKLYKRNYFLWQNIGNKLSWLVWRHHYIHVHVNVLYVQICLNEGCPFKGPWAGTIYIYTRYTHICVGKYMKNIDQEFQ